MGFRKSCRSSAHRDARVYRIFDGTSEILRTVIAKSVLSKGPVLLDLNR